MNQEKNKADLWTELEKIEDNTEKYEYLLEIGQGLDKVKQMEKIEKNIVPGCFSKVWCVVEKLENKNMNFEETRIKIIMESKSQIINGVLSIIKERLDNRTVKEIILFDPKELEKIGLTTLLTPTRANGIFHVIKFIKEKVSQFN